MRKLVTLILLFASSVLIAQNDVLVIYIDASAKYSPLSQIVAEVNELVDSKINHDVCLFISKGEYPSVTNDRSDMKKLLGRLYKDPGFTKDPDYKKDTELLNAVLLENNYISNINNISKGAGLDHQVEIHFWFNKGNYNDMKLDKKIVEPLLFSNKLKFKGGLQEYCTVILHLEEKNLKNDNHKIERQIYE